MLIGERRLFFYPHLFKEKELCLWSWQFLALNGFFWKHS